MDASEPGPSGLKIMTRRDIYHMLQYTKEKYFSKQLEAVETNILNEKNFPEDQKDIFLKKFRHLKSDMKSKWEAARRTETVFLQKYEKWLQGTIGIPYNNKTNPGRPQKQFLELSERSKRRKTEDLRSLDQKEKVLYASQMILRDTGNTAGATVLREVMRSPTRGQKYRKVMKQNESDTTKRQLTPTRALSMFVEAQLTRAQYEIIRTSDTKLYPCYDILLREKNKCYPKKGSIKITETCAEVQLQDLVDHTSERLMLYLEEVIEKFSHDNEIEAELTYKWGCDGSHQSRFKQKFQDTLDSDANIFQSSLVPLRLVCSRTKMVLWQNPQPSSPRFCRPMRIRFLAESKEVTNEEIAHFKLQIAALHNTQIKKENCNISVKHTLCFTMIDGKVCNAATDTLSTMRCYICNLTQTKFNNLDNIKKDVDPEKLQFGLSVLHARIRFFESLLHLAYKIPVQKWQIRSQEDKIAVNIKKNEIQAKFKEELGLLVDIPKPGFGNTNDGNTSRRFFANPEVSSKITGIELQLIQRFGTILEVISCGFKLDVQKFESYCIETAKLYVQKYNWHPMSPTLHKILIHGPAIIRHALLPIGTLSEEAGEARNKHFREYRLRYSRKFSREKCMYDVFHRLMLTSDPYISSIRPKPQKNTKSFSADAKDMFIIELGQSFAKKNENENKENFESSDEETWNYQ